MGQTLTSAPKWQSRIVWAVVASVVAFAVLRPILGAIGAGDLGPDDPYDDTMRLVQLRDWMGGQGWFDTDQHRLGMDGTRMHWSRLVDVPIAGLALLLEPFVGEARALRLSITIWPPVLGGVFMAVMIAAGRRFGGLAGMLIGALGGAVLITQMLAFLPGRIDHHNWQLILMALATTALIVPARRMRTAGIVAGLSVALSLSIGPETLVYCGMLCAFVALEWAWTGARARAGGFGLTLAVTTALLFVVSIPPSRYGLGDCDQISYVHVMAAGAGGLGLFALTQLASDRSRLFRLAGLGVLGVVAVILLGTFASHCLANPLDSLPQPVTEYWLSEVGEARGFSDSDTPFAIRLLLIFGTAIAAGALLLWSLATKPRISGTAMLLALLGVAAAFTAYQVRYSASLWVFSALAIVVVLSRFARRDGTRAAAALAVLGAIALQPYHLAFPAGLMLVASEDVAASEAGPQRCNFEDAAAVLKDDEPRFVMAPYGAGPTILLNTPHRVLASNYHRGSDDIGRQIEIATAPPAEALAMMRSSGIDRLVYCAFDAQIYTRRAPNGLHAALGRGEPVAGLRAIGDAAVTDGVARVFAVEP